MFASGTRCRGNSSWLGGMGRCVRMLIPLLPLLVACGPALRPTVASPSPGSGPTVASPNPGSGPTVASPIPGSVAGTWLAVKPPTAPSPRGEAAVAYDSARHRVVLFGGDTLLRDT